MSAGKPVMQSAANFPMLKTIALLLWSIVLIGLPQISPVFAFENIQKVSLHLPIQNDTIPRLIELLEKDMTEKGFVDIQIQTADHWHAYQQGLRSGQSGIYFAPPHFAAWAIEQYGFKPLVRLSEPLSYVIAAKTADRRLFEINDLAGHIICSGKPLNLDYLLINQSFNNSLRSAKIKIVASVEKQMRNPATRCEAFSVSNHLFKKLELEIPDKFIRLQQSRSYNNYVLLVHPGIPELAASKLQRYFLDEQTQSLLSPMLKLFSTNAELVRGDSSDYPASYWKVLAHYWGGETKTRNSNTQKTD